MRWEHHPSRFWLVLSAGMVAVAFRRNWHATWWEWHVLMLIAFGLVAWSAHRQWHEERFSDLYLDGTAAGKREISHRRSRWASSRSRESPSPFEAYRLLGLGER